MCIKKDGCNDCRLEEVESKIQDLKYELGQVYRKAHEIYAADPSGRTGRVIKGVKSQLQSSIIEVTKIGWQG